ncbi:hypothetical protein [Thermococcus sp.]
METINIKVPKEFEKKVKEYLKELEGKKDILKRTAGIIKTEKSARDLKVEIYEELYG